MQATHRRACMCVVCLCVKTAPFIHVVNIYLGIELVYVFTTFENCQNSFDSLPHTTLCLIPTRGYGKRIHAKDENHEGESPDTRDGSMEKVAVHSAKTTTVDMYHFRKKEGSESHEYSCKTRITTQSKAIERGSPTCCRACGQVNPFA